ncbi:MAG: two-component sensor histidine kinase [Chromatiaceae bacterium]|nr:two-component sensor histidine kinase [Chromatiaceae bacterium]
MLRRAEAEFLSMMKTILTALAPSSNSTGGSGAYPGWGALAWYALFRLCVAFGLLLVFVPSPTALWRTDAPYSLSVRVSLIYALLVLLATLGQSLKWPSKEQQIQISVFLDIVAFTLLLHDSGSARTALGLLLAIAVAAGALLMQGRLALLFASFATLGVLTQQVVAEFYFHSAVGSFTQAGLLGFTYFTVAMLAHVLYRRIQETEQLAARRQVDIDDLSELNEFIIQSMGTGVLVVDRQQQLRLMNGAAVQLLGLPLTASGARLQDVAPGLSEWLNAQRGNAADQNEPGSVTVHERELKPTCRPLGDGVGTLIFLRDNRELAREAQQIKLASLGRLTASIAHNIRNPLSAVSHAGQLLVESPALRTEDRRLLDIIRRNSKRIDETIESVLQLSRRKATPKRIELVAWLREYCTELREAQALSEERLRLVVPESALHVNMDPRHLHQIMSNLCDNALKHAGNAHEQVRIEIRARPEPFRGFPLIEVADNGPGIDPATAGEIFNPFFSTSPSGTGLGLYIAKELSETNGAELEYIESERPGTCFRLCFAP